MRILHCINSLRIGGLERLVIELLIEQKKRGLHADLLVDKREGEYYSYVQENKINIIDSGINSGSDFSLRQQKKIRSICAYYDIVHLHNFSVLLAAALSEFKTVFTIHGLSRGIVQENFVKYFFREALKKIYIKKFDFLVANSKFTLENSKKHYDLSRTPSKVILNGIRLPEMNRDEIKGANKEFTIGLVSRFTPRKRIDRLVNGFEKYLKIGGKGRLIIVGDGTTFKEIRQMAFGKNLNNKIHFTGYSPQVERYYSEFDVCVFPAEKEPFGLVAVEAYLFGKPVLAFSDSGGLLEIISPLDPDDIVEDENLLAERLLYHYHNRKIISESAGRRIEYAEKNFSVGRMEQEYYKVYLQVLQNQNSTILE